MSALLSTKSLVFNEMISYPDINIERGNILFLSGASGCGKSTLFRLLNATHSPSSGSIFYNGEDIAALDTIALRRKIILAGQAYYLFKGTIEENFRIFHRYNESEMPEKSALEEYLKMCCVDFASDAPCDTMSGGEKQRVFLSAALSMKPEVLLLDEPTSALDAKTANQVMENILAFCKQNRTTLLVISHDKALQDKYAETVIELTEAYNASKSGKEAEQK